MHSHRLNQAQSQIKPNEALLISDPLDIYYLTGFICLTPEEREAFVLLTPHSAYIFLSSFSAPVQVDGLHVHIGGIQRKLTEQLPILCQQQEVLSITMDGNSLRLAEYEFFKHALPSQISIRALKESPLAQQRMVKDESEIEALAKANAITHSSLSTIFTRLKAGMTELDVQQMLEQEMRRLGVTEFAFPTIVCFGDHSALPHHQPDNTQLQENQAVLIDCGAKWQKYCADVTRTVWFGDSPDPEFTKIETIVKDAYDKTFSELKNRTKQIESSHDRQSSQQPTTNNLPLQASRLDHLARTHITNVGFGPQFIHTTGHGVGLYIHEQPSLNPNNPTELKPGMIITIEPGIYLVGKFGYRFENSILVTNDSAQELL